MEKKKRERDPIVKAEDKKKILQSKEFKLQRCKLTQSLKRASFFVRDKNLLAPRVAHNPYPHTHTPH